jgi:hypothetical protein
MDGRVQLPVLHWIKANYPVDFVDVITEAGMDRVLSSQEDISEIQRSINVSINLNKSTKLFVVGHYDCRGNPAPDTVQHEQIGMSVKRLKKLWPGHEVVGLWVNKNWQVEAIPSAV